MKYVRKLSLWFALALFGCGISLFTFGFTASQTVGKPEKLKGWLEDAAVYEGLVSVASEVDVGTGSEAPNSLLTEDILKESAVEVFRPDVIQIWIESIIDGTYAWLDGEVRKPGFEIDTRDAKQEFASVVISRVEEGYLTLPLCQSQQQAFAAQSDPLNAECQVLGVSPSAALGELEEEILNNESFLLEGVYTADNISFNGEETPAYVTFDRAPGYFEWLKRAPFIALGIILLSATLVITLAETVRTGARKLGFRMITGAVFGLSGSIVLLFGLRALSGVSDTSNAAAIEDIVVPFVNEMFPDFILYSAAVSSVILVLGILILCFAHEKQAKGKDAKEGATVGQSDLAGSSEPGVGKHKDK